MTNTDTSANASPYDSSFDALLERRDWDGMARKYSVRLDKPDWNAMGRLHAFLLASRDWDTMARFFPWTAHAICLGALDRSRPKVHGEPILSQRDAKQLGRKLVQDLSKEKPEFHWTHTPDPRIVATRLSAVCNLISDRERDVKHEATKLEPLRSGVATVEPLRSGVATVDPLRPWVATLEPLRPWVEINRDVNWNVVAKEAAHRGFTTILQTALDQHGDQVSLSETWVLARNDISRWLIERNYVPGHWWASRNDRDP